MCDARQAYVSYKVWSKTKLSQYKNPESEVIRRYNDFNWLCTRLHEQNRGVIVPPMPEKNAVAKISATTDFIETRRRGLQVFINRVVRSCTGYWLLLPQHGYPLLILSSSCFPGGTSSAQVQSRFSAFPGGVLPMVPFVIMFQSCALAPCMYWLRACIYRTGRCLHHLYCHCNAARSGEVECTHRLFLRGVRSSGELRWTVSTVSRRTSGTELVTLFSSSG
jgi:hypothetical protein